MYLSVCSCFVTTPGSAQGYQGSVLRTTPGGARKPCGILCAFCMQNMCFSPLSYILSPEILSWFWGHIWQLRACSWLWAEESLLAGDSGPFQVPLHWIPGGLNLDQWYTGKPSLQSPAEPSFQSLEFLFCRCQDSHVVSHKTPAA